MRHFILKETEISNDNLTPELNLHLITDKCHLWNAQEHDTVLTKLKKFGSEPFWGFYWPGGQALTRFILDSPDVINGRSVLDFGCGCGSSGIASAIKGAQKVLLNDIDEVALVSSQMNAELNLNLHQKSILTYSSSNLLDDDNVVRYEFDVVLIGDTFYDEEFGIATFDFLKRLKRSSSPVILVGDPGRWFLHETLRNNRFNTLHFTFEKLAEYDLNETTSLENRGFDKGFVWRLL